MNTPLEELGAKRAFSAEEAFSAMSVEKAFLSEVKQRSLVEVNEEGTEAAIVTTATMHATFAMTLENPHAGDREDVHYANTPN